MYIITNAQTEKYYNQIVLLYYIPYTNNAKNCNQKGTPI